MLAEWSFTEARSRLTEMADRAQRFELPVIRPRKHRRTLVRFFQLHLYNSLLPFSPPGRTCWTAHTYPRPMKLVFQNLVYMVDGTKIIEDEPLIAKYHRPDPIGARVEGASAAAGSGQ